MNKIPNRQAICEVLMKHAETDKDIVVSAAIPGEVFLTPFANAYPEQFVEMGIVRRTGRFLPVLQNAARKHLRHLRRASFLQEAMSRRKIDCAYSNTNGKLIGISGGVSWPAHLGMSHHSPTDIAAMAALFRCARLSAKRPDSKTGWCAFTKTGWVGRMPLKILQPEENTRLRWIRHPSLSEGTDVYWYLQWRWSARRSRRSRYAERRGNQRRLSICTM